MTVTIHHATAKRAAKLGIQLAIEGMDVVAREPDSLLLLAQGQDAKQVLADAETRRVEDNEPDSDEPEDDEDNGDELEADGDEDDGADGEEPAERSIIKRKYRKRYQPMNRTCGDDMSKLLDAELKEDGILNVKKLIKFAKQNDCWIDSYLSLNPGQIRMNVGNRLRAKVRKGHEIVWG